MPSRQEKKRAKRQAKYLKTRDDILHSARASYKAEPEKKRASQRENYRAEPEKKRTSRRARYRADPEKERTSRRARYRADPEKKRTSRRARYRADPEKERAAKRQRYWQSPERARSAKRVKVTQSAITCVAITMSILKYIVPIWPGVSSKEDSDVRQTSGSTGSRSAEVILHSSESSSKPISGSDEVVGLLEECGHDEANAPDSPSPTTSPVTCTRIVPLKPNQPRLKFPMRQFGSKRRSFCYSWYEKYRWLHYIEEEDAVLSFYCATAVQLKMPMRGYMDTVFSTSGFFNWKKALDKFSKHDQSACHYNAISMVAAASTEIMNVGTQLSAEYTEQKALNRKCLLAIMSNIRFLAWQGLALRGAHYDADMTSDSIGGERESNFMQLLLLRKNEMQKSRDRFTCPEIQNEFLQIMAHSVLRNIAAQLSGRYYFIMVDETTDVSNNKQMVFCVRYVDNKLISHEEFIGLHSMDCISAEHITRTIEDILLRLSLPLQNCRGQWGKFNSRVQFLRTMKP
ncbi:hypothetical protein EMCRGX_G008377 [Ephydatia muelleri]